MTDKSLLIVEQLAELLNKHNKRMTVAESCTGGWIAKSLTDLAGSSAWFERGFVTYSNQAKQEMLGVKASTLENFGAVSHETVTEMAIGALDNSHADFSIAVSGIAGPDGGSVEKPVGLVWFSWASSVNHQAKAFKTENKIFTGGRNSVRKQAVAYALKELVKHLNTLPELTG